MVDIPRRLLHPNRVVGGGGSGNVRWGPKFGGLDGDEFGVGVRTSLSRAQLTNTRPVGATVRLSSIKISYSKSLGVRVTYGVGPSYSKSVGCHLTHTNPQLVNNKSVGCHVSSANLGLANSKSAGVHCSGTVLGAPFWQSVTTAAVTDLLGDTTVTCNYPSNLVVGDLLVAAVVINVSGGSINVPAGWTDIAPNAQGNLKLRTMYRYVDGTEGASQVFTWTGTSAGTAEIHHIKATHATTPVDASAGGGASVADPVVVSVTTTVVNCLVIAFVGHDHAVLSNTHTAPASHVEHTDFQSTITGNIVCSSSYTRIFAATGATGTATVNCSEVTATNAVYQRIAIAPGTLQIAS